MPSPLLSGGNQQGAGQIDDFLAGGPAVAEHQGSILGLLIKCRERVMPRAHPIVQRLSRLPDESDGALAFWHWGAVVRCNDDEEAADSQRNENLLGLRVAFHDLRREREHGRSSSRQAQAEFCAIEARNVPIGAFASFA